MAEGSTENKEIMLHCAGCGFKEDGDIKLKKCTACYLVQYCGVKCQREHWPKHKKECKKRASELRDEILFKQPENTYPGDCPICCVPLSMDVQKSAMYSCCCNRICSGCSHANAKREKEGRLGHKCPFCRHPVPKSGEEHRINYMKRVEANDPVAMFQIGVYYSKKRDYKKAFEYWTKAAKLGSVNAHFNISIMYDDGLGVEKDEKKRVYHLEEAAIGGHVDARYNLGDIEGKNGRYDRAKKHLIISAKQGDDGSLQKVKVLYEAGYVSKEEFATALQEHKAAVDATKSPQREVAEAAKQRVR